MMAGLSLADHAEERGFIAHHDSSQAVGKYRRIEEVVARISVFVSRTILKSEAYNRASWIAMPRQ
jgi:hypothetical protein